MFKNIQQTKNTSHLYKWKTFYKYMKIPIHKTTRSILDTDIIFSLCAADDIGKSISDLYLQL